jgi:hypothetical protein
MYSDRRLPTYVVLTATADVLLTLGVVYPPFNRVLKALFKKPERTLNFAERYSCDISY